MSAGSPREASVIKACLAMAARLRAEGCPLKLDKVHGNVWSRVGKPDLDGSLAGVTLKIEIKREGGEPTDIQRKTLHDWRMVGAVAFWTSSVTDLEQELRWLWKRIQDGAFQHLAWVPGLIAIQKQVTMEDAQYGRHQTPEAEQGRPVQGTGQGRKSRERLVPRSAGRSPRRTFGREAGGD